MNVTKSEWRPQDVLSLQVNRLARALSKQVDDRLAAVGLTISQLPVLAHLEARGELTQKELADLAGVAQPSMAQLLARMERDGLIQRAPSATDGRISLIALTELASSRLKPGRAALLQLDLEVCSSLTGDERKVLKDVLQRLVHRADGVGGSGS